MIVEAGVVNLFRTILIIIGVVALLRFIGRLLIAKRQYEASQNELKAQKSDQKKADYIQKNIGKTSIIKDSNQSSVSSNLDAEDVDFEDVNLS